MKHPETMFLMLFLSFSLYGQEPQQPAPLSQPKSSVGSVQIQPPKDIQVLTRPSSPVIPPNEFSEGQISERVETFGYRISQLEVDMRSVLATREFAKGAFWIATGVIGTLLLVIGAVLKYAWKPLVRHLIKDSYQ